MILQKVDPVSLELVSHEEADVIKHGHCYSGKACKKKIIDELKD